MVWPRTQGDLLPGVGGQQEDEQRQAGDEHAGDEQVEAVVEGPAPHGDGEGDVRVRLLAALVVQLVALGRHAWKTGQRGEGQKYRGVCGWDQFSL